MTIGYLDLDPEPGCNRPDRRTDDHGNTSIRRVEGDRLQTIESGPIPDGSQGSDGMVLNEVLGIVQHGQKGLNGLVPGE